MVHISSETSAAHLRGYERLNRFRVGGHTVLAMRLLLRAVRRRRLRSRFGIQVRAVLAIKRFLRALRRRRVRRCFQRKVVPVLAMIRFLKKCSICTERIAVGQGAPAFCRNGQHWFHRKCLNKHRRTFRWNSRCPLCNDIEKDIIREICNRCKARGLLRSSDLVVLRNQVITLCTTPLGWNVEEGCLVRSMLHHLSEDHKKRIVQEICNFCRTKADLVGLVRNAYAVDVINLLLQENVACLEQYQHLQAIRPALADVLGHDHPDAQMTETDLRQTLQAFEDAIDEHEELSMPMSDWQYIDRQQNIQGPFPLQKMQQWNRLGYLAPSLPMRCHVRDRFVPLADLFPHPLIPFQSYPKRPSQELPESGWEYIDYKETVQGPFTLAQMQQWDRECHFRPSLLMRCDPSDCFSAFGELFPDPLIPFTSYPRRPSQSLSADQQEVGSFEAWWWRSQQTNADIEQVLCDLAGEPIVQPATEELRVLTLQCDANTARAAFMNDSIYQPLLLSELEAQDPEELRLWPLPHIRYLRAQSSD